MQLIVKIQIGFEFYFVSMPTTWLSSKGSKLWKNYRSACMIIKKKAPTMWGFLVEVIF